MLIGQSEVLGTERENSGFNPSSEEELDPGFGTGSDEDVARACSLAAEAFDHCCPTHC